MSLSSRGEQVVVAVYGASNLPESSIKIDRTFIDWCEDIAGKVNKSISHFDASIIGPNTIRDKKCYLFDRKRDHLGELIRNQRVHRLALHSLPANDASPAFDWEFTCSMGTSGGDSNRAEGRLGFHRELLLDGGSRFFGHLLTSFVELVRRSFRVEYGFSVAMPRSFFPAGYVVGVAGTMPHDLISETNAWRRQRLMSYSGVFRNVYGLNLLTIEHLSVLIDGCQLSEYIINESGRGAIEDIGNGLYFWTFAKDHGFPDFLEWDAEFLAPIRARFRECGLIYP